VPSVPLSGAARQALGSDKSLWETILTGGDDYEIIASISAENSKLFASACAEAGVIATEIGVIVSGETPPRFFDENDRPMTFARLSFSHF
jgi:thiamine-monophosphate kinase